VRWTGTRIGLTVVSTIIVVCIAAVLGAFGANMEEEFGYFLASVSAPLLWLVATVLIWKETATERAERFGGAGGRAVACPRCGYNLTGLSSTQCPECGAQFTLDELAAGMRPDSELQ
jgi:DNA-directed RNA polymerase subunit RPC12/RpoP